MYLLENKMSVEDDLKTLREQIPKDIAKSLVDVQPMDPNVLSGIFTDPLALQMLNNFVNRTKGKE